MIYAYCVYTAVSCMLNMFNSCTKKAKTLGILVEFLIGHLRVYPFVLFLLAIVLSVLLRFTDSDYPIGIFKLFLQVQMIY
jgi:hypothetical protein